MLNSSLAPNVVKTALDLVFNQSFGYDNLPGIATAETGSCFKPDTTDRAAVITEQFKGPGYFQTRTELQDVPQNSVSVTNQKTFSVVNYSASIDISKNLMDDDQHQTVDKM